MEQRISRGDVVRVSVIGFLFGWLLLPILQNINISLAGFTFILPFVFALFAALALFAAWFFSKYIPPLYQFAKFAAVGALNFSIDFGIYNIFILATGVSAGSQLTLFKAISAAVAIVNSYLWNKFWTFSDTTMQGAGKEIVQFLVVTLIGFGINVGATHVMVNIIGPLGGVTPKAWANIGAFVSILATLFWNFFGYKFFVFKRTSGAGTF